MSIILLQQKKERKEKNLYHFTTTNSLSRTPHLPLRFKIFPLLLHFHTQSLKTESKNQSVFFYKIAILSHAVEFYRASSMTADARVVFRNTTTEYV